MSELNINVTQAQGNTPVTVMELRGHLHGETEGLLLDRARQSVQDGSKHILLDLSGVDVLTSAGLRAIHNIFNLLTPQSDVEVIRQHRDEPYKSPYLKLLCPNPQIYYVLNISGFLQNIPIYNDLDEALRSFSS
jgi:anti-anti-sigma factor